jgi:hypothetical protein
VLSATVALGRPAAFDSPVSPGGPASPAPRYAWPLDFPPALTSSFGEYRARHFHGGIDLSTGGTVGKRVLAVADGTVERVRASGAGYGLAVYLALEDGRSAVYAHLDSFAPSIERWVAAAQDSLGRFEIDLAPPRGLLRFRRGEEIGRSGESGAGAPHLHFELRTGDRVLNPLRHGLEVEDDVRPSLASIRFVPWSAEARVEGGAEARTVALHERGGGRHAAEGVTRLSGKILVVLRARDRATGRANPLALYRLRGFLDGVPFFEARLDTLDILRWHEVDALYGVPGTAGGRAPFLRLHRPGGTSGGAWPETSGSGILDFDRIPPGRRTLRLLAEDAAGNASTAEAVVIGERRPVFEVSIDPEEPDRLAWTLEDPDSLVAALAVRGAPRPDAAWGRPRKVARPAPRGSVLLGAVAKGARILRVEALGRGGETLARRFVAPAAHAGPSDARARSANLDATFSLVGRFLRVTLRAEDPLLRPVLALLDPGDGRAFPLEPESPRAFAGAVDVPPRSFSGAVVRILARFPEGDVVLVERNLDLYGVARGDRRSVSFGALRMEIPPRAAFEPSAFRVVREPAVRTAEGLVPVGDAYTVTPPDLFFDAPPAVSLAPGPAPERPETIGLYQRREGRWSFLASGLDSLGLVTAPARAAGTFALFRDTAPPVLSRIRPANGAVVPPRARLAATVRDAGSGVTWQGIRMLLDGKPVLFSYDVESRVATAVLRSPLEPGRRRLEIEATDRCGNTARAATEFRVRAGERGGASGRGRTR